VNDPGRVLILGAGPTGLGAAYRLHELGVRDWAIVEAAETPGGLASSVVDARGFTWDLGGHVQFSHYAYYDAVLDRALGAEWLWHERQSWIWLKGRFVPYPFQHNLHRLDRDDCARALRGLEDAARATHAAPARSFGEWIRRTFGGGIADLFLEPYNLKVWGCPLEAMDAGWVGDRVAVPDVARIRQRVEARQDDVSWGPNQRFRFPARGGTGRIWREVAALVPGERTRLGCRVADVSPDAGTVGLGTGERLGYDTLVSTLPLDVLVERCAGLPAGVRRAARGLVHSAVHVVGVGLRGGQPDAMAQKCWIYFPEPGSPYYRVTVFSHYSPFNVPPGAGHWSLMAEVCESRFRPVETATLPERTVAAMRADGLLGGDAEVVSLWHTRLEHGYPTPFLGRDDVLAAIVPALERRRIYSRGRFGGWKYEVSNQDHGFMQGVELIDRLVLGEPEVTYPDPARANSGVFLGSAARAQPPGPGRTR
jgi:protoporphyrinogen oxidase